MIDAAQIERAPQAQKIVRVRRPCSRCGQPKATLELRRYPTNHPVAWQCAGCLGLNRSRPEAGNKLFIPHRELRGFGIDPDSLPEIIRPDAADEFLKETADLWPGAVITRDTRPNGVGEGMIAGAPLVEAHP
jgi:hypothetical protein